MDGSQSKRFGPNLPDLTLLDGSLVILKTNPNHDFQQGFATPKIAAWPQAKCGTDVCYGENAMWRSPLPSIINLVITVP